MKKFIILAAFIVTLLGAVLGHKFNFQEKNQTLNLAVNNFSKSFDPAIAFNDDSLVLMSQSMESLYQYHYLKRPFEVIPALADGMPEITEGGKVYRIKIKPEVYYHPHESLKAGRTVKAKDFEWQIKRIAFAPLDSTGAWLFEKRLKGFEYFRNSVGSNFNAFLKQDIEGVKVIDDLTLELHLVKPEPNLIYFLAMQFVTPVPLELIKRYKNNLQDVIIGTGPYIYKGIKNSIYEFEKNKKFREEFYPTVGDRYANTQNLLKASKEKLPFIRRLKFHVISNEDERWEAFNQGDIDILDVPKKYLSEVNNPSPESLKDYDERGIEINYFPSQSNRWLGFNMTDPIFKRNKNLRLAIAHSINFDKYIEYLTKNTNLRSNSIYNPSISGYDPSHTPPYEFNLEKAKRYLNAAGYKPGELTITYSTRGTQEVNYKEAEFIQAQLAQIGIKVKINVISFSDFLKLGRAGKLQFWTDGWIYDYPDSENLLQLLISRNHPGINKSGYSNTRVDRLYNKLTQVLDVDKRVEIMQEVEKIVESEIPWVLLVYDSNYVLKYKNIKNYRKSFFSRNFPKYLEKY